MKKAFVALAIIMVAILLITGCGSAASTSTTSTISTTSTASATSTTSTAAAASTTSTTSTTPKYTPVPATTTPTTTTSGTAIQTGGTLRFLYPYSPTSTPGWPLDDSNVQRMWMEWTVFEPLVKPDKKFQPIPWLATSWDWGPQNQYITFHLRQNVKFSDGTDFTSDAVKTAGDLAIAANEAFSLTWASWQIVDDYTITLNLKQYQNDFWTGFYGIDMCFFSPTAYRAHGVDWMKENPIGTGPFIFKDFQKDVHVILTKNPNYWQPGKPYLNELDFITVVTTLTAQSTMQAGQGDVWALQQGKTLYDMKNAGFNILYDYGGSDFLLFDTIHPNSITSNVLVREAMEYAINKQAICDSLGYGYLIPNNQWSPPSNPTFNANLPSRDYNPAKAIQLLSQAGYPNGCPINIICIGAQGEILSIQQYLQAVGFKVTLESVSNAAFWNYCMTGWNGVMFVGYAIGSNFASALKGYFPPKSVIDVSETLPADVMSECDAALLEQDPVKAKADNDAIIQELYDWCYLVPIDSNAMGAVVAPRVQDSGIENFSDWSVWSPENCWLQQ